MRSLVPLLVLAAAAIGGEEPPIHVPGPEDRALAEFFTGLYDRTPQDCAERFAVNHLADPWRRNTVPILSGRLAATEAELATARTELSAIRTMIGQAGGWPRPPTVDIPRCATPPRIDGDPGDPVWKAALTFREGFAIGERGPARPGQDWRLLWDEASLYVLGSCSDASIVSHAPNATGGPQPWNGDCLEFFVLPDLRLKTYWEIVVNPRGEVFDGLHRAGRGSSFASNPEEDLRGLRRAVRIRPDGYDIELALPFSELPGYMLGNAPQAGQTLRFMPVRIDDGKPLTPVPLLYTQHNLWGYIIGTLR